jgi:hypothetical protein
MIEPVTDVTGAEVVHLIRIAPSLFSAMKFS